jgi:hypothetical protein
MPRQQGTRAILGAVLGTVLTLFLLSCQNEGPVAVDAAWLVQAQGPGGPPPKVTEAIPNWAEQEMTVDVQVLGSGYDEGSVATFTLDGNPAGITTDSTTFVSGSELRAHIRVALDADLDLYDVEVMTIRGKKGIGADLFQVVAKGSGEPPGQIEPIPLAATFLDTLEIEENRIPTRMWSHDPNPFVAPGNANRAEILLSGNFQVHWSGFGPVEVDLNDAVWLNPDNDRFPPWFDSNGNGCGDGDCTQGLDGYVSTGFPFDVNGNALEDGFRDLVPGQAMVTAMHKVWTEDRANWVLHFHAPSDPADECSHLGLTANHMTVQVVAFDTGGDPAEVDAWTIRAPAVPGGNAFLCGFAAKGKPFTAFVGWFQVPAGLDLVRLP